MRDNRGNRRDHEWIDRVNDGDRMINIDNSPSHDPQSKPGVLEGGNHDETMYDVYGGQGVGAVPPFSSDMAPPPVLMPVPGAGFVVLSNILLFIIHKKNILLFINILKFIFKVSINVLILITVDLWDPLFLLHLKLQCRC